MSFWEMLKNPFNHPVDPYAEKSEDSFDKDYTVHKEFNSQKQSPKRLQLPVVTHQLCKNKAVSQHQVTILNNPSKTSVSIDRNSPSARSVKGPK